MRGGEKVLEVLCEIFPDADLYTIIHIPGSVSAIIEKRNIKTSFIQRLPGAKKRYRSFLPLFPMAIEGFNLSGYDLVISSSHCVAKGVIPPPRAAHIAYIHTPMRYVWDKYYDYFGPGRSEGLKGRAISLFSHYLRMWDVTSSVRVDHFISNSAHVAKRVEKFYRRESSVIYPPVDCGRFKIKSETPGDYYLVVSAFAPYKRIDTAINAFNQLGLNLKVIGTGQDEKKLKKMAAANIEFLGWKSDAELAGYYADCRALIFTGEEDFGIVPLEAAATGRAVIAFARGGALETVIPIGEEGREPTGVFFYEQTPESLMGAIKAFEDNIDSFKADAIRKHALAFDRPVFKEKLREHIFSKYQELNPAASRGKFSKC
ncbi:MAG: glycosyltransferase [Deltaproteobacteria bacterium]|nr:glycosyltransferase [Deltaproteobacteria bacterium]